MTLQDAMRHFRWDTTHDCSAAAYSNGHVVALYSLGLYEADLTRLKEMVPGLVVSELRRVEHDHGTWLRVDVAEKREEA